MIHIVRNNAFGDVLWVEPVARYFIEQGHNVNVITWKDEVFANYPSNHLFINHPLPKWQKSILKRITFPFFPRFINLNMAYETNPKMHLLNAYFKKAKILNVPLSSPRLFLTDQEKIRIFSEKYALLHIEKHQLNYRNVYGVNWAKVVRYVQNRGFKVLQLSKSGEDIFGERYNAVNFRDIMRIIYNCEFFIGVDSGPSHITTCFDKPSIIFFGAVNPYYRHLSDKNKIFLQKPCEYAGCYHEITGKKSAICKISGKTGIPKCCLHTTENVIENIARLLQSV